MLGERAEPPLDHVYSCEEATGESLVFSGEQEDEFTTDGLDTEDFQTVLTEEYDILLVEAETGLYHVPAMRCDSCGTIDEMVYAPTYEVLDAAMGAASSAGGKRGEVRRRPRGRDARVSAVWRWSRDRPLRTEQARAGYGVVGAVRRVPEREGKVYQTRSSASSPPHRGRG
jgi:hypothetical protein